MILLLINRRDHYIILQKLIINLHDQPIRQKLGIPKREPKKILKKMSAEISSSLTKREQEECQISQEFESFLSNLPKEEWMVAPYIYQYQGFWYAPKFLQAAISFQKHFQAQDSDILLVTTPKSGTTWIKAIIFSLVNRDKYPPNSKNHPLISSNPHDLVPFLEIHLYANNQTPEIESFPSPRLFSTHMPYLSLPESVRKTRGCKIVYLCRNPKDVLVSFWHFAKRVRLQEMETYSLASMFAQFSTGVSGFGPFWDHVLEYWNQSKENSDKIFFLKFEDLKRDPGFYLRRLAEFLECPFSAEEEGSGMVEDIIKICSFENLSSLEINQNGKSSSGILENKVFFRQGEVGDWKNHLSDEMVNKLDEISKKKFAGSGLDF